MHSVQGQIQNLPGEQTIANAECEPLIGPGGGAPAESRGAPGGG